MFGWLKRHREYARLIERQAAEMIRLHGTRAYQTARTEAGCARDRGDTAAANRFRRVADAIARIERVWAPDPTIMLHH